MATILEALQNARHNICEGKMSFQYQIGKNQLINAVELLDKGYSLNDDVEELIGDGTVDAVPEKE